MGLWDWVGENIGTIVQTGATVGATVAASQAAKDAAAEQANAINSASKISAAAAQQARKDVLSAFGPSYQIFTDSIQQGINALTTGQTNTTNLLMNSSAQANQILNQTSQNVQRSILGLPPIDFTQQQQFGAMQPQTGQFQPGAIDPQAIAQLQGGPQPGVQDIPFGQTGQFQPGAQDPQALAQQLQGGLQPGQLLPPPDLPGQPPPAEGNIDPRVQVSPVRQLAGQPVEQMPLTGLIGAESALTGAAGRAQQYLMGGPGGQGLNISARSAQAPTNLKAARDFEGYIRRGTEGAVGELEQFASTGEAALQKEAALSGALGAEAQQAAINEFTESPGQAFLRQRQEQALLRNQAAIGGLGGGNVRTALQEQAFGIAAQQQQQQIENLRALSQQGLVAAGQQGGFRQQGGIAGGQIAGSLAGQELSSATQLSGINAQDAAAAARQAAQLRYQIALQQAGIETGLGTGLANLRTQAGQQIAGTIGTTGQQIAGNVQGLGQSLGQVEQQTGVNLANLLVQGGQGASNLGIGLGNTLANIGLGQGVAQAGLVQNLGSAQAAGILGQNTALQQGLTGLGQIAGQQAAGTA